LDGRSLGKTNIIHCKVTCRVELDIGRGTAESAVECDSILGRWGLKELFSIQLYLSLTVGPL